MEILNQNQARLHDDVFVMEDFMKARDLAWESLRMAASKIEAGMKESDIAKTVNLALAQNGCKRMWHKTIVRVAENTRLGFKEDSALDAVLEDGDIYFIDIGPVFFRHEADVGRTFTAGLKPKTEVEALRNAAEQIYENVAKMWKENTVSGKQLLDYASQCAQESGYRLSPSYVAGHRLSSFPHPVGQGSLFGMPDCPHTAAWVLEIQIECLELGRGAFYEDLLF